MKLTKRMTQVLRELKYSSDNSLYYTLSSFLDASLKLEEQGMVKVLWRGNTPKRFSGIDCVVTLTEKGKDYITDYNTVLVVNFGR